MLIVGRMTSAYDQGRVPEIEVRHRLQIAREAAGLEQKELAVSIGVSRNTIGNYELGRTAPRRIVINAWALACGVPVTWILTGHEPTESPDGGARMPPGGPTTIQPTDRNTDHHHAA